MSSKQQLKEAIHSELSERLESQEKSEKTGPGKTGRKNTRDKDVSTKD